MSKEVPASNTAIGLVELLCANGVSATVIKMWLTERRATAIQARSNSLRTAKLLEEEIGRLTALIQALPNK